MIKKPRYKREVKSYSGVMPRSWAYSGLRSWLASHSRNFRLWSRSGSGSKLDSRDC